LQPKQSDVDSQNHVIDTDALASIAENTATLKELEAQLCSVLAFGGI